MSDFGLSRLFDSIGGALHIFDFSFFISGSVTLSVIVIDIITHYGTVWLNEYLAFSTWIVVVTLLIAIYVCGLISWMIGRGIRECFCSEYVDSNEVVNDFNKEFESLIQGLNICNNEAIQGITVKSYLYSYMWLKLDATDTESVKRVLNYCNRLWVMRALFEGLIFSWLTALVVMADLVFFTDKAIAISAGWIVVFFFLLVVLIYFSNTTARNYARSQLKEIVIAYKVHCIDNNLGR